MDLALQTKLLRFLQTGSLQRIGSEKLEHVDVRVVCATNKDPYVETMEGRFREDLYYRLNVIPIFMPPLRERGDDAVQIANELVKNFSLEEGKEFSGISPVASSSILKYSWPGNVRELANVIRRVVVMHEGPVVELGMLPGPVRTGESRSSLPSGRGDSAADLSETSHVSDRSAPRDSWVPEGQTLASLEREIIEATIDRCQGNIPRAAAVLGVSPSTLYRKQVPITRGPGGSEYQSSR